MKISMVCATIGPINEVSNLLESIIKAARRANSSLIVEFILVDQSCFLGTFCFPVYDRLHLIHIRSLKKGLSLNRNIGLSCVSGDWIVFMDSDCMIQEDYFRNFISLTESNPEADHFIGRILDPCSKLSLFRRWPSGPKRIKKSLLWYYATSVNNIFKANAKSQNFDEDFGLGAKYGSCEDVDFFLRLNTKPWYTPELVIFHPDIFQKKLPSWKLESYSFGFGALCAKHARWLGVVVLFSSLMKKFIDMLRGRATLSDLMRAIRFRLKGFRSYRSQRGIR